ncbi:hypothetical protein [Cesiribacter sp. SM1]|uniref:hypothetical protein n=1 Tax=Cesiribacter sp. SM1 TaxID=2861196 RepID=UPI001CD2D071|nr:hypothetical protein [Cesiribacter sp. SM1]
MQLKLLFSKWTQVAALLLIGGAVAWTIKLGVIIATNGRIIDTGAAALFMKVGLLLLLIGSTGIGNQLSLNRTLMLRIAAIIFSPVVAAGLFLLFAMITKPLLNPLLNNSGVWYAQQEAPIALAVVFFLSMGCLLYRSYKPLASN